MISLNDAALVMGLASTLLALRHWPRLSMVLSAAAVWFTVLGWRKGRAGSGGE